MRTMVRKTTYETMMFTANPPQRTAVQTKPSWYWSVRSFKQNGMPQLIESAAIKQNRVVLTFVEFIFAPPVVVGALHLREVYKRPDSITGIFDKQASGVVIGESYLKIFLSSSLRLLLRLHLVFLRQRNRNSGSRKKGDNWFVAPLDCLRVHTQIVIDTIIDFYRSQARKHGQFPPKELIWSI